MNILDRFKLGDEKENFQFINDNIRNGVAFKGTNLWILIFAIFIASLGLNVNSTAVIIGAMLISPLMGPIMGIGFSLAINDITLLKRSAVSFLFATTVSLITSTVYFLISPLNDAHSELLARTAPNIYDVLIAIFGGLAGMLAVSSKLKGNVIPGVAIATALMPPLCTAGYGLATLQLQFFFGAFYLFTINTVFIAAATLASTRFFKYPLIEMRNKEAERKARAIVWSVTVLTLLPSIYFGYNMIWQDEFEEAANHFIDNEAVFANDYLLKKDIDAKKKSIVLTYGGQLIEEGEIAALKSKLPKYNLNSTTLEIRQGFSYLKDNLNDEQANQLAVALSQVKFFQGKSDSLNAQNKLSQQIFKELKIQYPGINSGVIGAVISRTDTTDQEIWIAILHSKIKWAAKDKTKIKDWLKVRINNERLNVYYD